jgi:hypothetical protein
MEATHLAQTLSQLNAKAHAESKLLVRGRALDALREAIESELGSFQIFVDTIGGGMKVSR